MEERKKLKILFLITALNKGGAERFLVDFCNELQNYPQIDFIIGTLYDNNEYQNLTKNFKIINLDYKLFSLFHKTEISKYKEILETYKPDIVHTNLFFAEFLSSYYVDNKIKYVCHGHDNMFQFKNFNLKILFNKSLLANFIEKQILIRKKYKKCKTYFIANSKHTEKFYKNALPKRFENNVKLIYYGFNFDKFYYEQKRSIDKSKPLKLLMVGSFQDKKNQIFSVEIAKELKKRGLNFEINLIGQGGNFELVNEKIKEINLEKEVVLRGLIHNVEDWYKDCDIYLHTAWYEPFGLVFLEAMAAGLPIVCLDGKGNRDIVEQGKNGFLFYEQNPKPFADAIENLYNNTDLYQQISEYAKQYAKQFNAKDKFKELVDFYYKII
ncbi:MAG: glycosyltransferase family 4 protein [Bacteroidetes bacterium]|nr:glycosyltransferase family 4 protein [Bacteroidota bacterium]